MDHLIHEDEDVALMATDGGLAPAAHHRDGPGPGGPGGPGDAAISIRGLSKVFTARRGQSVRALSDISLQVAPGEFVSILGPSGCGKSTLLSLVAGLEAPTEGEIDILVPPGHDRTRLFGIVFQRDLLLEWRTTLANTLLSYELRGVKPSPEDRARAQALLEQVGLGEFLEAFPHELSGGMRQRAAICRALVTGAPFLLMDEPFASLDALTRERMNLELAALCRDVQKTVLFITHSIEEAVFLSDRIIVLSGRPGRLLADIPIDVEKPRPHNEWNAEELASYTRQIRGIFEREGVL